MFIGFKQLLGLYNPLVPFWLLHARFSAQKQPFLTPNTPINDGFWTVLLVYSPYMNFAGIFLEYMNSCNLLGPIWILLAAESTLHPLSAPRNCAYF